MLKISELVNKYFKYLVAAIIIIVPLYPKFPLFNIPGTYVSVRFEDFLLLVMAIFIAVKIFPNIKNVFKDGIIRAIAIFLLIGFVSLFSGIFLLQTVSPSIGVLHLLRRLEYFIPGAAHSHLPIRSNKPLR